MTCRQVVVTIVMAAMTGVAPAAQTKPPAQDKLAPGSVVLGDWSGIFDAGVAKLTLVVHIAQDGSGALSGTLDSPAQNATGIPIEGLAFENGKLRFEAKRLAAVFEGRLSDRSGEIVGTLTQRSSSVPLALRRGLVPAEPPKRPQEPQPPFPYREEDVTYPNPAATGVTLAGTLTLPSTPGPFPAVLLVSGSGPHDRNEWLMGHKPFLVLADHLARRGLAVLRVDDRGTAKSTGSFATATSLDFSSDALAGIAFLRSRREINPKRIGIIGHSEGGLIAPMVAAKSADVAFVVLMAGPGVTGEETLYEQARLLNRAGGATEEAVAASRRFQEQAFAILKAEPDPVAAEKLLRDAAKSLAAAQSQQGGKPASVDEGQIRRMNSPWYRFFLTYDPRLALRQLKIPVLAINGERDLQVPPRQHLPEIAKALKVAGNKDHQIVEMPGLNHLFQSCDTGSDLEYGKIDETINPAALSVMSTWIVAHTRR